MSLSETQEQELREIASHAVYVAGLIRQDDGISWLGIHVALVALALVLVRHNKLALLKKW